MPRLYAELASWWPLLSHPDEYAEEAAFYIAALEAACVRPPRTVLELGSGGGNNASHMKGRWRMTLVDPAAAMLDVSRALNPGCEHVEGDMRTVRLGRTFDAVFVHDAVCYLTTEDDLRRAMATAFLHCAPGGAAIFAPDFFRETFEPSLETGGRDEGARGLRFMAWVWDPDPADRTYLVDYAYLLREADGTVRAEHDRHVEGLFSRQEWLAWLAAAGFDAAPVPLVHSDVPPGTHELFVARRPDTPR